MGTLEPTKVCSRCRERKPWSDFYRRTVKGHTYCTPRCKRCDRAYHEQRRPHPEQRAAKRARDRARYQRQKADIELAAIRRDQSRESARRRLGITPDRYRTSRYMREGTPRVAVALAPFAEWLSGRVIDAGGVAPLARRLGIQEKRLRVILAREQSSVELATVDKAVTAWGEPEALNQMYPPT